jgi:hypothetical protein
MARHFLDDIITHGRGYEHCANTNQIAEAGIAERCEYDPCLIDDT